MAEIIADRIKEATTSTGTGDITLTGAVVGFRSFSSVCALNDTFSCAIVAVDSFGAPTGAWEIGNYTFGAANTIQRTVVTSSSNNNGYVSFAAGTKHVYIDFTAYQIKLLTGVSTQPAVMPFGQDSSQFTSLTFSDEFNSLTLDTNKWATAMWFETDNATKNYSISGGALNIWPQRDSTGAFFARSVNTDGKFYQTYGYFEVEAQLPVGFGCLPSFWMYGRDNTNRPTVNVFRAYSGGTTSNWANTALHPIDYEGLVFGGANDTQLGSRRMHDSLANVDLSSGFHKYAAKWEPTGVTFYFDGIPVGTKVAESDAALDARMFFILSLGYGAASGDPNVLANPKPPEGPTNPLRINYIRAWQLINQPVPTPSPGPSPSPTPSPSPAPGAAMPYGRTDSSIFTPLTYEDHFDGTTLSTARWSRALWYEGANNRANYGVSNSTLKIWGEQPFDSSTAAVQHNRTLTTDAATGITSPFAQAHGYFECSAKLPIGKGYWPGWWLYAEPGNDRPEVDIMEAYSGGGVAGEWSTADWHPNNYAGNLWHSDGSGVAIENFGERKMSSSLPLVDLSAGFHRYSCMVENDGVTFYFDGNQLGTKCMTTYFANKPLYLILDLWFGSASGAPSTDPSLTPLHEANSFEIDYVRVWQLKKYT